MRSAWKYELEKNTRIVIIDAGAIINNALMVMLLTLTMTPLWSHSDVTMVSLRRIHNSHCHNTFFAFCDFVATKANFLRWCLGWQQNQKKTSNCVATMNITATKFIAITSVPDFVAVIGHKHIITFSCHHIIMSENSSIIPFRLLSSWT